METPRGRDAAGSQGFESLLLRAYRLTSPFPSHSTSTTKQEEDGRTWNTHQGVPCVSTSGKGFKRERRQLKLLLRKKV